MHIFIDESGPFIPQGPGANNVSAVGGLVLASCRVSKLYNDIRELMTKLHLNGEIKGARINESEISEIITLLAEYDAILVAAVIDAAAHSPTCVRQFQQRQVEEILAGLPRKPPPSLKTQVEQLAELVDSLPSQLFIQSFLMIHLIRDLIETGTQYYCQRQPGELGHFAWRIDAKAASTTPSEKFWTTFMTPAIQFQSGKVPSRDGLLEGRNKYMLTVTNREALAELRALEPGFDD